MFPNQSKRNIDVNIKIFETPSHQYFIECRRHKGDVVKYHKFVKEFRNNYKDSIERHSKNTGTTNSKNNNKSQHTKKTSLSIQKILISKNLLNIVINISKLIILIFFVKPSVKKLNPHLNENHPKSISDVSEHISKILNDNDVKYQIQGNIKKENNEKISLNSNKQQLQKENNKS